jgi:hypothetical protein
MLDSFASHAHNFKPGEKNTLPIYIAKGVDYQNWRMTQHYDFTPMGVSENRANDVVTHRSEDAFHAAALIEVPAGPTVKLTNVRGVWRLHFGLIVLSPFQALKLAIEGKNDLRLLSPDRARQDMIDNLIRGHAWANIDEAIVEARLTS